jgi:hypothetical protein
MYIKLSKEQVGKSEIYQATWTGVLGASMGVMGAAKLV